MVFPNCLAFQRHPVDTMHQSTGTKVPALPPKPQPHAL